MAQIVCVLPPAEDRERLMTIVADRNRPLKHVQRARIVLYSTHRLPVQEVARRASVSRPAVWRWQARYAEQGVEGLLRDRTRKPGRAPLSAKVVAKVMDLTCFEPPGHATHWTGRAMAKAVGVSLRAVQRLWQAHRLQPHRIRTFKRSNDPEFAEKVEDIVGLYMDPPKHTVVASIDEKSQIQALDRTQPGLPLKPGKCGTMTHDYKRNGTTTLFAALNILDGTVIGRCMRRHRHQEFIRFLNAVERAVPAGKVVHAIVDNYAAHKQPNVLKWLADHPRWTFHFTPTSASWLNAVEGFFSAITRRQIRRGAFHSVDDLQNAITRYINAHNSDCRPAGDRLHKELALSALRRAVAVRCPSAGLIHHADRGSQYCSVEHQAELRKNGISISMSGKGNCFDNAMVETFFKTLKAELVRRTIFQSRIEAASAIGRYIDGFYNPVRRHSALDFISPLQFEERAA